jgi:hypothetical protein
MSVNNLRKNTAYGLSDALLGVAPSPIVSKRDPGVNDMAPIGQLWVNASSNAAFVLTSLVANQALWSDIAGGGGSFASLNVGPGNITATAGNVVTTAGNVVSGGQISATTTVQAGGDITSTGGSVISSTGSIVATAGSISAGANVGAAAVVTGGTGVTATTGNVVATAGAVKGVSLYATGDLAGVATTTGLSNVVDITQSTGALSILSKSANPGNNAGFIKAYVGVTVVYIPYFTNIAP